MRPVRIPGLFLTALLLTSPASTAASPVQGQQEAAVRDTAQITPQPGVIPAAAIPAAADSLSGALRALREQTGRTAEVQGILEALPPFSDTLASLLEDPAYRPGEGASLRRLDRIRRRWEPLQERLGAWERTLAEVSGTLAQEREALLRTRGIWERTRETAVAGSAPEALVESATSLLQEIDTTRAQLGAHLDTLLLAVDQVSDGKSAIQAILNEVDSAEVDARGRLLSTDSPPLWRALVSPGDTLTLRGEIRGSWTETTREWRAYIGDSGEDLAQILGIFVILFLLLQALRRQAAAWARRGAWPALPMELEGTERVLSRPISAAVLLATLVWRIGYTPPSTSVRAVVMMAMVVPVFRLIPSSAIQKLGRPLLGLAGLWVLGEGATLTLDGTILQRLALLLVSGIGVGLYWTIRPGGPLRTLATGRWGRAALTAEQVGIVVMGAAVVANILGLMSLAEMLTRATIHSAVAAAIGVTLVTVFDGLIWMMLHTDWALRLRVVQSYSPTLTARLRLLARVGIAVLWVSIVLGQYGIQRSVVGVLGSALGAHLTLGTFALSLGDALAFGLVLWLSLTLARGIRTLLEEDLLQSVSLPRGIPTAISTLVHYAAVFIGFLLAAAAAGFDMSRFTLLAGAFGVGLGFGLQNIVNNFVSGLILIFERPIQVGDVVEVGGIQGSVKGIGIRASTVRTWNGAEVIVPNGDLISQQVTNWTLSDRLRRMEINVGVKYGTDPRKVIELLTETVGRHPEVLKDPPPYAVFQAFGASSLDFVVRAWTSSESWFVVNSDLAVAVNDALAEAEIEIPFPQRDLHLRSVAPGVRLEG